MESRKMIQRNLFESRNRDKHLEKKYVDTKGEGEGGGRIGKLGLKADGLNFPVYISPGYHQPTQ